MNAHCIIMLLCFAAGLALAAKAPEAPAPSTFGVYGYLPEYRYGGFNYTAVFRSGLTHLIFFSLEIDVATGVPSALDRLPTKADARRAREAADAVGGKLLLCFGGNARSAGYSNMVRTPATRARFLTALDKLLRDYKFDGVDYNWEYPRNDEEWRLWGTLLAESKQQLLGGSGALVTLTMYLDPRHYDIIARFDLLRDADVVHCMAYDMHGEHSTFEFAQSGIDHARRTKLPLHKFSLGVPFYARAVDNGEPKTYGELVPRIRAAAEKAAGGDVASVWPRMRRIDRLGKYYFNGPAMIRRKTRLAIDSGAHLMIWELGQDYYVPKGEYPKESLMAAIQDAKQGRPAKPEAVNAEL